MPSPTPVLPLLYSLDLSHNKIKTLGRFFQSPAFSSLHALSLANNYLTEFPEYCLSGLGQLQYLSLARNLLRNHTTAVKAFAGIGQQLGGISALTLDFSDNAFSSLLLFEEELQHQLTHLFLLRNPICQLSEAEKTALPSYYYFKLEKPRKHYLHGQETTTPFIALYGHAYNQ